MRAIDAVALSEGIELHRQGTDQEYESDRQWAVGYNAGLDRALYSIAYAKTIFPPPNDPLTLEELREMDGEPVWITKMDGSGGVWMLVDAEYELCREAHGEMAVFENCGKTWLAYRRRPAESAP